MNASLLWVTLARLSFSAVLGLAVMGAYYLTVFRWVSFYANPGIQNVYLTPLVFPYQLEAIERRSCGQVRILDGALVVEAVGAIAVVEGRIAGQYGNVCHPRAAGWFVLNTQDGTLTEYASLPALQAALRKSGSEPALELVPAEDYFARYWAGP